MRWIGIVMLAALCTGVSAGEDEDDATEALLELHTAGIEAWTKLGDLQARKGNYAAAEQAYREAIRLYDEALRGMEQPVRVEPERIRAPRRETDRAPLREVEQIPDGHIREAVGRGLNWLSKHQDDSGIWSAQDFMRHDPEGAKCEGSGGKWYDIGVTGLSLVALMGADNPERFGKNIAQGLERLVKLQDDEGCLGARASQHFIYNHAVGTLALCEGYRRLGKEWLKKPAQDALNWLAKARNPYMAWRYEPRGGENDTSVTGWCVHALFAGKRAGLEIDPDAFEGARAWFDKVTDPATGRTGYNMPGGTSARPQELIDAFPGEKTEAMTASAILGRILLGEDPQKSAMVRKGLALCLEIPPRWDRETGRIDMYYWFHGTLAARQVGGDAWGRWRRAIAAAVVRNQREDGSYRGSWDPVGPWGPDGGRVYATALMVQSLQACLGAP